MKILLGIEEHKDKFIELHSVLGLLELNFSEANKSRLMGALLAECGTVVFANMFDRDIRDVLKEVNRRYDVRPGEVYVFSEDVTPQQMLSTVRTLDELKMTITAVGVVYKGQ